MAQNNWNECSTMDYQLEEENEDMKAEQTDRVTTNLRKVKEWIIATGQVVVAVGGVVNAVVTIAGASDAIKTKKCKAQTEYIKAQNARVRAQNARKGHDMVGRKLDKWAKRR